METINLFTFLQMERLELSREYSLDPKSSAAAITPHLPLLEVKFDQI